MLAQCSGWEGMMGIRAGGCRSDREMPPFVLADECSQFHSAHIISDVLSKFVRLMSFMAALPGLNCVLRGQDVC